jgi:hypothetical protein
VLLGQGYCTPHGAVTDEYGSNGGMVKSRRKTEDLKETALVPLCPLRVSLEIPRDWNPVFALRGPGTVSCKLHSLKSCTVFIYL